MKKLSLFSIFALGLLLLSSCGKDECTTEMTYIKYDPIYKTTDEIRQPISVTGAQALKKPGKIYLYRNYILVNEQLKGIHVIDNSDPHNPNNVAFINIDGNLDMAVKGNILYADNYIDLLSIDITDVLNPRMVDRDEAVFPSYGQDINGALLVAYDANEVTEDVACSQANGWGGWMQPGVMNDPQAMQGANGGGNNGAVTAARSSDASAGIGGSMARFTISGNHLFTVDNSDLHTFDINNLYDPEEIAVQNVGWANIETIFPHGTNLFIGSNTGMFIYDISNPAAPVETGVFQHAQACDPVFVSGNRAYVTLRGGTPCQNFLNQLDVIDITNLNNPTLITSHDMHNPHGLSIKDETLYLCDGDEGLKVFDAANDFNIGDQLLSQDAKITTYDVIASPTQDLILVIGEDGFFQYDVSDPANLQRISEIPVSR